MHVRLAILILCVGFFSGCAGSSIRIASMSPEELQSVDETRLCSTYYYKANDNLANEISRRKLITESEWTSIKNKQISAGMKRCGVFAALGNPHMIMRKPIEGQKEVEALVFPVGTGSLYPTYSKQRAITVYLVDGVVTKVDRN